MRQLRSSSRANDARAGTHAGHQLPLSKQFGVRQSSEACPQSSAVQNAPIREKLVVAVLLLRTGRSVRPRVNWGAGVANPLDTPPCFHQAGMPSATVRDVYGLGTWTPVRVVLTVLNKVLMPPPRAVAPAATARAMKTISMAYSVAVAPRSSRRKRLKRLSILSSFCKGSGFVASVRHSQLPLWRCPAYPYSINALSI